MMGKRVYRVQSTEYRVQGAVLRGEEWKSEEDDRIDDQLQNEIYFLDAETTLSIIV